MMGGAPAMDKKFYIFISFLTILTILTPACTRSASQSPIASVTPAAGLNFPVGTQPPAIPEILTQTAVANGAPQVASTPGAKSPQVKLATAKPTKKPTYTETAPAPTSTPGRPSSYVLQYGEWPVCIARRFNLNIDDFFAQNGLTMQSMLLAGTVLYIPDYGQWNYNYGPRAWHSHPAQYVVQAGDNIHTIACFFGDVGPDQIKSANNLKNYYSLYVGQVLNIP
jgi:LysM domain